MEINEELKELFISEATRIGERTGLEFMITQFEYEGTWNL